jgi:YD repeat-containing protein
LAGQVTNVDNGPIIYDSIGRQIAVTLVYQPSTNPDGTPNPDAGLPKQDIVTYPGWGGASRTVTINYGPLAAFLSQGTTQSEYGLFPELAGANHAGTINPYVISSIILADNASKYSFLYNKYGELTQLQLPTGGVYQYQYQQATSCSPGGDGVIAVTAAPGQSIYRRLTERDELSNGADISAKTLYTACVNAGAVPNPDANAVAPSGTIVTVDYQSASGISLRKENHYYYGDPSSAASIPVTPTSYPAWTDGLEYQTDILDGTVVRRSQSAVWTQTACAASEPCWFPNRDPLAPTAPTHGPQVCLINNNLDSGPSAGQAYLYDLNNNATDVYEFDYGSAPLASSGCPASSTLNASLYSRHTQTSYNYAAPYARPGITFANSQSFYFLSLPASITVTDKPGNSYTRQLQYDQTALTPESQIVCPTPNGVSYPGYDCGLSAQSGGSLVTGRGNVTSDQSLWSGQGITTQYIGSQYAYDNLGNVLLDTDADTNVTKYDYTDANNSYAKPTTVTSAYQQPEAEVVKATYDYSTGLLATITDPNNAVTTYSHTGDVFDRLQSVNVNSLAYTSYQYPSLTDTQRFDDQNQAHDRLLETETVSDGFGRPLVAKQFEDSTHYIAVCRLYDSRGRASSETNPVETTDCTQSNSGALFTTVTYDSMDRVTSVTTPDSLSAMAQYSQNTATVTDDACASQQVQFDGLGRVKQVTDDPSASANSQCPSSGHLALATQYAYDLLDNLVLVTQGSQQRQFNRDSLGRVYSSVQPEASGAQPATTYKYWLSAGIGENLQISMIQ